MCLSSKGTEFTARVNSLCRGTDSCTVWLFLRVQTNLIFLINYKVWFKYIGKHLHCTLQKGPPPSLQDTPQGSEWQLLSVHQLCCSGSHKNKQTYKLHIHLNLIELI